MDNLVEKIEKYTLDGSPTVSELIELQEIARKTKVSRTDLEKLIKKALLEAGKSSNSSNVEEIAAKKETIYKRPDYDAARNSFEAEMNQRRAIESIPESPEITFNRPEIVFPEMDDPFAKKETTTNDESTPFLRRQEISDWFEKPPTLQEQPESEHPTNVENIKKEKTEAEKQQNNKPVEKVAQEPSDKELQVSIGDILGAVSDSKKQTKEAIDNTSKTPSFDTDFERLGKIVQRDNLDDWIKNSNQEKAQRAKELKEMQEQKQLQDQKEEFQIKQQSKNKKKRSFSRDNDSKLDDEAVKLTKSAFALGITALVLSILFGTIGAIVGIFALNSASKGIKKYKINARSFEKGAISKLKNGRTMAIIGIVIGVFKFGRMFYWGYYFF